MKSYNRQIVFVITSVMAMLLSVSGGKMMAAVPPAPPAPEITPAEPATGEGQGDAIESEIVEPKATSAESDTKDQVVADDSEPAGSSLAEVPSLFTDGRGEPLVISSDSVTFDKVNNTVLIKGNVKVEYSVYTLTCDQLVGVPDTEETSSTPRNFTVTGNVAASGPDWRATGDKAVWNTDTELMELFGTRENRAMAWQDKDGTIIEITADTIIIKERNQIKGEGRPVMRMIGGDLKDIFKKRKKDTD